MYLKRPGLASASSSPAAAPQILIVGASARAAAASAARSRLLPMAIDLFGDRDLKASPSARIPRGGYPRAIPRLARGFPSAPFLYTGALENHPEVIARLARERELWGTAPEALRRIRDPFRVRAALLEAGLPSPRCSPGGRPPPASDGRSGGRRWLWKPLAGAGGRRIGFARRGVVEDDSGYFQEFIAGTSCSAIFVAARGRALYLGATLQLVGEPDFGARPFAYCGSVGPLDAGEAEESIRKLGGILAARFGLVGIFGVDLVVAGGAPYLIEVNPRYTASVEILEEATGVEALALHARACRGLPLPAAGLGAARGSMLGKAILFARREVVVARRNALPRRAADLPRPGERIGAGRPICSIFARGRTAGACLRGLVRSARAVYRRLGQNRRARAQR